MKFPGMFEDIFPDMFGDINVWRDFEECLRTLPGMCDDIPQNV